MRTVEVVAGIIKYNDQILCMQRGLDKYNNVSYKWEFPGGKIENGETKEEALIRELIEELEIKNKELEEEKASYEKANRIDTVNDINAQIEVLSAYLPKLMSEEEIKNVILSLEDKSVPAVMKHFKANYNGKCDMALVNKVLKSL